MSENVKNILNKDKKQVSFGMAFLCMVSLALIFVGGFALLKISTQVVFLIAIIVCSIIGIISGFSLQDIESFFLKGCKDVILAAMILMAVGAVIGSWIVSGIVPTIIYYGLSILTPATFIIAGFLICCIISFFTGSSYTAISTLGVAFMGIGIGLNINPAITAGMVVSGSVFGDKLSPFSDSTNLAAAVSDCNVFEHVRSMLFTTIPAVIISGILYFLISLKYQGLELDMTLINNIKGVLDTNFNISPILLIVPIFTIFLAVKKVPPLVALIISSLMGIFAAFLFQGSHYELKTIINSLGNGFSISTDIPEINKLLNRGGMLSMMGATALAFLAVGLGEILQSIGVLDVALNKMNKIIRSEGILVIFTLLTSLIVTILCASQYISIILTGQLMKNSYTEYKVKKTVLSRTLEDGGTIFCYLIPWTTSGVYIAGVLDIEVAAYAPYAFFCILCPILAAIYAFTGFAIFKEDESKEPVELSDSFTD